MTPQKFWTGRDGGYVAEIKHIIKNAEHLYGNDYSYELKWLDELKTRFSKEV